MKFTTDLKKKKKYYSPSRSIFYFKQFELRFSHVLFDICFLTRSTFPPFIFLLFQIFKLPAHFWLSRVWNFNLVFFFLGESVIIIAWRKKSTGILTGRQWYTRKNLSLSNAIANGHHSLRREIRKKLNMAMSVPKYRKWRTKLILYSHTRKRTVLGERRAKVKHPVDPARIWLR